MKLSELVLDGFKSYPVRTTISDWDPSFNAVTGLNGSGKSNILDAICFVLGITNMTQIRAANLQDLIYKRGQAGITKASVTIVFDNSDRSTSPVGFEAMQQVTVTRQVAMNTPSKYLICGHRATQQAVQNLFQSIQLNINNPNFLIMQGKITKVLNMKPPEILGMIEEAAGTRMYEDRRTKAVNTMAKKDKKMEEIQQLIREEINPKMDKLKTDKRLFLEYQTNTSELEKLSRLVIAHNWLAHSNKSEQSAVTAAAKQEEIKAGHASIRRLGSEIEKMRSEMVKLTKKRDKETAVGGKIQKLEAQEKELSMDLARMKTQIDLKSSALQEAHKQITESQAAVEELLSQKTQKTEANAQLKAEFEEIKKAYDEAAADIEKSESLLQTLITGLSTNAESQDSSGFMGQLASARAKLAEMGGGAEEAKVRLGHLQKELKEKEPRAKKAQSEDGGLMKEMTSAKADLAKLESQVGSMDQDNSQYEELRTKREAQIQTVKKLSDKRDSLRSGLTRLNFDYTNPSSNFDRNSVKGLVANLIAIEEANFVNSTALEICAGGRLYNVVVDNENVGSQLLAKGRLQQRVTIIPLTKINAFVAAADKLTAATRISKGKAKLALSLVGYANEVEAAMKFVFGNTLICDTTETAKAVTFDKSVRMKSVTQQGDVYDPSGTLTGGSEPNSSQILVKVQELKALEEQLNASKTELLNLEKSWDAVQQKAARLRDATNALDLKRHEVKELEERNSDSNAARLVAEVEAIKQKIADINSVVGESKTKQKELEAECKRIQKEMNEFKNNRESKLKEIKDDISKKKAAHSKQTLGVKTMQRNLQTASLEATQMDTDISRAEELVTESKATVTSSEKELASLQEQHHAVEAEHAKVEAAYREETQQITAYKIELDAMDQAIRDKEEEKSKIEADEIQLTNEIEKITGEGKKSDKEVRLLSKEHPWIADEKDNFDVEGGQFEFSKYDMDQEREKCAQLQQKQKSQGKKVNHKVMNMIDSVEKREKELDKMHQQVLRDKKKIEETISKLDEHKLNALQSTWEKVSADFGGIFGELLPGNFAKLEPPDNEDITQGLEVKVRLGQIWKQSLTELSGGQRSLIALSLIMSLLQFKPAPMYILDEVDAALDLSHTQHIGQLFKTRFKGSQFIVVSLKEGLFTNANVLFRTRFRDGTSIVERTAQRSVSGLYDSERRKTTGNRQRIASAQSAVGVEA